MAEVKNAFIKSKMNKDLDSRLIPSGEYRNAINAQISKSEGSDVGALENVLGNKQVSDFGVSENVFSIGYLSDEASNTIYVFLTDNDGSYTANPNDYIPPGEDGSNHYVVSYNVSSGLSSILVTGAFLNFSKLNPIFGVNLIEDLLIFLGWFLLSVQNNRSSIKFTPNIGFNLEKFKKAPVTNMEESPLETL